VLLVGNTREEQQNAREVKYCVNCTVRDLAWVPESLTLIVSTENTEKNHPLYTYDAQSNKTYIFQLNSDLVTSLSFSSKDLLFFL